MNLVLRRENNDILTKNTWWTITFITTPLQIHVTVHVNDKLCYVLYMGEKVKQQNLSGKFNNLVVELIIGSAQ